MNGDGRREECGQAGQREREATADEPGREEQREAAQGRGERGHGACGGLGRQHLPQELRVSGDDLDGQQTKHEDRRAETLRALAEPMDGRRVEIGLGHGVAGSNGTEAMRETLRRSLKFGSSARDSK